MKKFLLSLLAVFLIIEEWLWDLLSALGHQLVRWLRLENLERWLSQTSPPMALLAIMIPVGIVTPINLLALWLLLHGLIIEGILLEVFAKLLGTLLIARVFSLTKSQLLTFKLFSIIYTTISAWLHWAHEKIVDTAIYRYSREIKVQVKARVKAFFHK